MASSSAQEMLKSKNFSSTCNLLSKYLKENKGSLGIAATTLSSSATAAAAAASSPMGITSFAYNHEFKSLDLFPQHAGVSPIPNTVETNNTSESAQMTIFHGGKIIVLDNLSTDKAKQILGFANKFSGSNITNTQQASNNFVAPNNNLIRKALMPPPRVPQQQKQQPIAAAAAGFSSLYKSAGDVPAAKNNSLQRFLAKRKERISARAPYQVKASSSSASIPNDGQPQANEVDESKTWLGLCSNPASEMGS